MARRWQRARGFSGYVPDPAKHNDKKFADQFTEGNKGNEESWLPSLSSVQNPQKDLTLCIII
jgi:hypothetical protein